VLGSIPSGPTSDSGTYEFFTWSAFFICTSFSQKD
jgi:hypothetical protein